MNIPRIAIAAALTLFASAAHASFLHGDALDAVANGLALFILFAVPVGGIWLFWLIHILPEKVAEKRHHPQKDAIKTLCLLSLLFGGMLWPFAWLWAYTKPVTYKMAYGTEKHSDYYREAAERAMKREMTSEEIRELLDELDRLAEKGHLTAELRRVRKDLAAADAEARSAATEPPAAGTAAVEAQSAETAADKTRVEGGAV